MLALAIMVAIIITSITMLAVIDLARIGIPMAAMTIAVGHRQRLAAARPGRGAVHRMVRRAL
jgi:hypothetical protein